MSSMPSRLRLPSAVDGKHQKVRPRLLLNHNHGLLPSYLDWPVLSHDDHYTHNRLHWLLRRNWYDLLDACIPQQTVEDN